MRGMVRKSVSVVLIIAVIVLVYSLYSFISIETGDGMAGYLTKNDRLFSVDYTDCENGNVVVTLRNLDSVAVKTSTDIEIIRKNDNEIIQWDTVIRSGETATFSDKCEPASDILPCRYLVTAKRYGLKREISILC